MSQRFTFVTLYRNNINCCVILFNTAKFFLPPFPQLYKNRFCGLVVIPEVINNIRSKRGTFDWLMAKYWVGCLQEAFNAYNTFIILKTLFCYSGILKIIMVNKTKCFSKLIPTSWHKPVYLREIQTKCHCLHYIGSLWCLWKKELTKFVKEMFSFTNIYK